MQIKKSKSNKKILVFAGLAIILIVLAVGFFGYQKWRQKKLNESRVATQQNQKAELQSAPVQEAGTKRPGTYEAYDPAKFVLAKDGKVVLFFNASWSKTSKQLDKELKDNTSKLPNNFTIMSVDYNKNTALRKKYNVPFENTFVQVDENGVAVNSWSGSEDMAEIIAIAK